MSDETKNIGRHITVVITERLTRDVDLDGDEPVSLQIQGRRLVAPGMKPYPQLAPNELVQILVDSIAAVAQEYLGDSVDIEAFADDVAEDVLFHLECMEKVPDQEEIHVATGQSGLKNIH